MNDCEQNCTIIYISDSRTTLAGNNEDTNWLTTNVIFLPAEEGKLGRVYFGRNVEMFPQGGMNEKGLFFDGATAERVTVPRDSSKPYYDGNLMVKALETCSTVEEVLTLFETYDVPNPWGGHYLVGDRFGNSAIIEPMMFIRKKGRYQIATNFFQSKVRPEAITDVRYRIASGIFEGSETISVDLMRHVLSATRWDGANRWMVATLYSYICDLKQGDIYIYNFHNYEDVVKINLKEELKKGKHTRSILSLFPYMTFAERQYKTERYRTLIYERVVQHGMEGENGAVSVLNRMKASTIQITPSEISSLLNTMGYRLLREGKQQEAIMIFIQNVAENPESANAYDSLGEGYMKAGEKKLAIFNYEKSLKLDPQNINARKMLEELRNK